MTLLRRYIRYSSKNGLILIYKLGGRWEVMVNGTKQTSKRYPEIWADAAGRAAALRNGKDTTSLLLLGLAGGGALRSLYQAFPGISITAVEYDPQMVSIARELELYQPYLAPTMVIGDAGQIVPSLQEMFDVIVIDLFSGLHPSPLLLDEQFLEALKAHLNPDGVLLINACVNPECLEPSKKIFTFSSSWQFGDNTLAAFKNRA